MKLIALPRTGASRTTRFGPVGVCELRVVRSGPGHGALAPEGGPDSLRLVFAMEGEVRLLYRGAGRLLRARQWVACGAGPVVLSAPGAAEVLVVAVRGTLPGGLRDGVHDAEGGVGKVLLSLVRAALQAAAELTPQARAELGRSLEDLAQLALRESGAPTGRPSRRNLMRERVKAYVRHNLHDSALSIEHIAQAFHCTKRYLHKVFSEDERSLNQTIWDLRLERCAQDLADVQLRGRSITEIALSWGFCSSPHFSRAFRQRFGASPSGYRALHVAAAVAAAAALPAASAVVQLRVPAGMAPRLAEAQAV